MDYVKLSKVTDSANDPKQPKSVDGLQVEEKKGSVLDNIQVVPRKKKVTDSKKPDVEKKVVFIDDAYIVKVMTSSRVEKRQALSKLSDAQRRRFLDRWAEIKDNSVDKLTLVNAATLLQNAAFSPSEYNKNLLKEFVDEHKEEDMTSVAKLANWIINSEVDPSNEEQKAIISEVVNLFKDNGVQNSLREALTIPLEVSDSVEVPEEIVKELEKQAKDLADCYLRGEIGLTDLVNGTDNIIYAYSPQYDINKVEEIVNGKFNEIVAAARAEKVKDSIVDKIAEAELLDDDGKPVDLEPKPTVLQLLSEAMEAFANGDDSKMQNLAQIEVEGATVSLETKPKEEGAEENEEPENEDGEDELHLDIEEEDEESLADSVSFARALLKKDTAAMASLCDKLASKVPQIAKYNLRVVDYVQAEPTPFTQQAGVVNPPMSRDEYHSIRPEVPYCTKLAKQLNQAIVPTCAEIVPHEDYIDVTAFGNTQRWMPITGSVADLQLDQLETPEAIADKISTDCVPVYDALKVAAATNNLDMIDNKFYKKRMTDSFWSYDETPSCVDCGEGVDCSGCVVSQTQCGEVVGTISIFGTPYFVVRV